MANDLKRQTDAHNAEWEARDQDAEGRLLLEFRRWILEGKARGMEPVAWVVTPEWRELAISLLSAYVQGTDGKPDLLMGIPVEVTHKPDRPAFRLEFDRPTSD